MFCAKCGNQLADGAKFCPSCGAPVNAAPQQYQQPQYQQPQYRPQVQRSVGRAAGKAAAGVAKKAGGGLLKKVLIGFAVIAGISAVGSVVSELSEPGDNGGGGNDNSKPSVISNSNNSGGSVKLSLSQTTLKAGEMLVISYSGVTQKMNDDLCFIGIAPVDTGGAGYTRSEYVTDASGTVEFEAPLASGQYEARFYKANGGLDENITARAPFTVVDSDGATGGGYWQMTGVEINKPDDQNDRQFICTASASALVHSADMTYLGYDDGSVWEHAVFQSTCVGQPEEKLYPGDTVHMTVQIQLTEYYTKGVNYCHGFWEIAGVTCFGTRGEHVGIRANQATEGDPDFSVHAAECTFEIPSGEHSTKKAMIIYSGCETSTVWYYEWVSGTP